MKQQFIAPVAASAILLSSLSTTVAAPFKVGDTIQVKTAKGTRFSFRIVKCKSKTGACRTHLGQLLPFRSWGRCAHYRVKGFTHRYCANGRMNWAGWRWWKG